MKPNLMNESLFDNIRHDLMLLMLTVGGPLIEKKDYQNACPFSKGPEIVSAFQSDSCGR